MPLSVDLIPAMSTMMTRSQAQAQAQAQAWSLDFDAASRAWRANKRALRNGCFEYVASPEPTEPTEPTETTRKSRRDRRQPERLGHYYTPMTD
jgi:hypothetical protein